MTPLDHFGRSAEPHQGPPALAPKQACPVASTFSDLSTKMHTVSKRPRAPEESTYSYTVQGPFPKRANAGPDGGAHGNLSPCPSADEADEAVSRMRHQAGAGLHGAGPPAPNNSPMGRMAEVSGLCGGIEPHAPLRASMLKNLSGC